MASIGLAFVATTLGGCATTPEPAQEQQAQPAYSANDRDCLVRAIYFEANRSSDDGMLAIGTVVINRVKSGIFPDTICGVVGQRGQFAAGVMTSPMQKRDQERIERIAQQILEGKRHPLIASAMFFHRAGLKFHYPGMHYVLVAGGNAFYEKTSRHHRPRPADAEAKPAVAEPAEAKPAEPEAKPPSET
jgi:spore germination cell wall hydrolase CwlJ-like protein